MPNVSVGNDTSSETTSNPGTLVHNSNGTVLVGAATGRNSAGGTPSLSTATYDSVGMTKRGYVQRTWVSSALWEVGNAAQGSNIYDPDGGDSTYSAWGCVSLIDALAVGSLVEEGGKTGLGTSITLDAALQTTVGGIIIACVGRGHDTPIADPAGWTNLAYETEDGGGGALRFSYKLTDGTPINPVFALDDSFEWAISVATYKSALRNNQIIVAI